MQANDLYQIELLEIEMFYHLTVWKQITDDSCWIELLVLYNNTCDSFTFCIQMINIEQNY